MGVYVKSNMGLKDELVVVSDPNDELVDEEETTESTPAEELGDEEETTESTPAEEPEEEEEEEEDLIDPKDGVEAACEQGCQKYAKELQVCTDRVNSRNQTEETCEQELMDMMHCVDACVAKNLFTHLK